MSGLLNPSAADLEAAALSALKGSTQLEREMGVNVLFVAATQAREMGTVLAAEVVKLRTLLAEAHRFESSLKSIMLEHERPTPQTSATPASPPRLSIVRPEGA